MDVPFTVTVPGPNFENLHTSINYFFNHYNEVPTEMGVEDDDVSYGTQ